MFEEINEVEDNADFVLNECNVDMLYILLGRMVDGLNETQMEKICLLALENISSMYKEIVKVLQWELKECNPTSIECSLYVRYYALYQRVYIIHRCRARRHPTCLKTITLNFWIVQNKRKY